MERNITLDYFKLILSILVISIHLFSYNDIAEFMDTKGIFSFNRIAVPCFFLLNGYFLGNKLNDKAYLKAYLKKIITFIIVWNLIYFYKIPLPLFNFFEKIIVIFLGTYHLWYLSALFSGVICFYLIQKYIKINWKSLVILSFVCFIVGFTLQYYVSTLSKLYYFEGFSYKNGLFFALPFLILGNLIFHKQDSLIKYRNSTVYLFLSIFLISFFIEIFLSRHIGYSLDIYISLFFLAPTIFLLVLKKSKCQVSDGYIGLLSQCVYFIHPLIILLVTIGMGLNYFDGISGLYLLPLVTLFALIASAGIIELNKKIKIFL